MPTIRHLTQRLIRCLILGLPLLADGRGAGADTLVPVRLLVSGTEVRSAAPLSDGKEIYVSPDVLAAFGYRGTIARDEIQVEPLQPAGAARRTLRLFRMAKELRLALSHLAELVDGVVHRPARLERDGTPAPAKPGDWVHLLARVRSVRVEGGAVRIDTSFPVPLRTESVETADRLQDLVECVGATLSEQFRPAVLPPDERRVRAIAVEQPRPDLVRVRLELFDPVKDACDPDAAEGAMARPEPLRLDDLLRQVQATFPKLAAADAQRRAAAAKALEKAGAFDPVLSGGTDFFRFPDSDKPGKLKSFSATDAAVELLTPYGIKVVTGGRLIRGDVKSPLSLTGDSGEYFVGVKVPLLGGAGLNEKSAALRQSRLGLPLADSEFDQFRLETLLKAAASYWDWVAAGQRLQVARDLLKLAEVRAAAVKARAEAGDLPLIDVTEADQEVQRRIEGREKAERDLQKETFKLSLFLWQPDGSPAPLPGLAAIPSIPPPPGALQENQVQAGRTEALQRRPELKALDASRRITEVSLALARNQRLPALEVTVAPGYDTGEFGAGATLKAGVSLGLPLRQRAADGRAEDARLKLEKLELDRQLERQRILTEVEDAVSAVRQTYQRYLAASRELELARRLEQGERQRFDLGDSTLFLVNQRERATAEAAVKVIAIRAEYEQSLVLFRAVTAQL